MSSQTFTNYISTTLVNRFRFLCVLHYLSLQFTQDRKLTAGVLCGVLYHCTSILHYLSLQFPQDHGFIAGVLCGVLYQYHCTSMLH